MNCERDISLQIEKIKITFQSAQSFCAQQKDLDLQIQFLESVGSEFSSIAYEAASMTIALQDLLISDKLNSWYAFAERTQAHAAQVYAGLGWALAKKNLSPLNYFNSLPSLLRFRIIDGCGYYDGVFRQNLTLENQKIPENIEGALLQPYDQGVGRSIWYKYNGDMAQISELISRFSVARRAALWRGTGVASIYVGGCDEDTLNSISLSAQNYKIQLAAGAVLVARSRVQANAITSWVELACRLWCGVTVSEAMLISKKTEPASSSNVEESYNTWLSQIEAEIVSSQINKRNILK